MPIQCARCGLQNPDCNAFCQNCGARLGAVPPAVAPGYAAPPPVWPMYQQAAVAGMPVQRTSSSRVLAIAGGLIGGIIALFLAVTLVRGQSPPPPPLIAGGGLQSPAAAPSPAKPAPSGGVFSAPAQPKPSPAPAQAKPSAAPPGQQGVTGQGTRVSNSVVSMVAPRGWQVKKDDSSISLAHPTLFAVLTVESVKLPKPRTLEELAQSTIDSLRQKHADAEVCVNSLDGAIGGITGLFVSVCYSFTPPNGEARRVGDVLFFATNNAKTVMYSSDAFMATSDADKFGADVDPSESVQWLLR